MGALGRVLATTVPSPFDDYWYEPRGLTSFAGVRVTPETALKISAVWRCVNLIANTMATMPLLMYRVLPNDGKERASNHPIADVLKTTPNAFQTGFQFKQMMTGHLLLRGNAYADIVPGPRGPVDQLVPIHPDQVKIERLSDGRPRYKVLNQDGSEARVVLAEDMFHLAGYSSDGVSGISVVGLARQTLGLGIAMDTYAGSLFGRGVRPSGVLKYPKTLNDTARGNLRRAIDDMHTGAAAAGRPMLLEEGMDWQSIGMTNVDAEFLASRQFNVVEIARWFGVAPHKVMELQRSTNNNIEHQAIEWVSDGVLPWAKLWESAISRDLIVAPNVYFAEFLLAGLLRGDLKTRYEAYAVGRQWGWLSVNDIRRLENMNPITGGDTYLTPLNMVPAGGAGAQAFAVIDGETGKVSVQEVARPQLTDGTRSYLRLFAGGEASRIVRKEMAAMTKLAERTTGNEAAWAAGVRSFYEGHGEFVAAAMHLPDTDARQYAINQRDQLLDEGPDAMATWELERVAALTDMATLSEVLAA